MKEIREFNQMVFVGLIGGLMVYWSQIAITEFFKISKITPHYVIQIFGSMFIAILIFIIFAVTNLGIEKIRKIV